MKKNYMTQELSLSTELLEMALDFNELIDASSTPVWGIFGAFSVTPGRGGPMIAFETNGPSYSEEADETDPIAPEDPDSAVKTVRNHIIDQMEELAAQLTDFVALARAMETADAYTDGVTCEECGMGYTWGTTDPGTHAPGCKSDPHRRRNQPTKED